MDIIIALVLFGGGLGLIIFLAEQLVKGVVGTSMGFGLSTFLLSVIFIGFDPDNLAVGTVASVEGVSGIALGSILGGAMVAIALAFGISALLAPMGFAQVPPQVLGVQMLAVVLLGVLALGGAQTLLARFQISDLPFGMTILAFLVSIEELERELPAARQGRPDISFGNVLGSILAFFLCNAGLIALVRPVPVDRAVLTFYLPLACITTAVVSGFMLTKRISRGAGSVFILLYTLFVIGGWLL
jgi:Ca2+/Na+ antiporter